MEDDDGFYVGFEGEGEEAMNDEEFGDDDFEGEFDEGGQYMSEMGAGDRSHGGMLGASGGAPEIAQARDSTESFQIQVDAICRNLNSNYHEIRIDNADIQTLVEKSSYLVDIEYKNAYCYVLGWWWTMSGRDLSKERFQFLVDYVIRLAGDEREEVDAPAVLRYGRLWEKQIR